MDGAVRDFEAGFVVQHLYYCAQMDRYAVTETVWEAEPTPPGAYPVGKPHPDGTAPLRYVEEGEDVPEGMMVAWDSDDVPP